MIAWLPLFHNNCQWINIKAYISRSSRFQTWNHDEQFPTLVYEIFSRQCSIFMITWPIIFLKMESPSFKYRKEPPCFVQKMGLMIIKNFLLKIHRKVFLFKASSALATAHRVVHHPAMLYSACTAQQVLTATIQNLSCFPKWKICFLKKWMPSYDQGQVCEHTFLFSRWRRYGCFTCE